MSSLVNTSLIFKYHLCVLSLTGQHPPTSHKASIFYYLYVCFASFQKIIIFLTFLSFGLKCVFSRSMQELFECMFVFSTIVKCVVNHSLKTKIIRAELPKLQRILDALDAHSTTGPEILQLQLAKNSARRCFFIFFMLFYGTLGTAEVIMLLAEQPMLLFESWFPWDWQATPLKFCLTRVLLSYGIFMVALLELFSDTFPQACMCILGGHLRALALRLHAIKVRAASEQHLVYAELVYCIKDHKLILQAFKLIQSLLSLPAALQLIHSTFAMCTLAFSLINVDVEFETMFVFIMVFIAFTFMSFLLCYFGELLRVESENLTVAIYACNWPQQNVQFRKCLLLLLRQSQANLQIQAANLYPLNLKTFLMVTIIERKCPKTAIT